MLTTRRRPLGEDGFFRLCDCDRSSVHAQYARVTGKFEIQVEMISIQVNLILTWVEIESTKHEQKFNQLFASTCILVSKSVLEGREYG